MSEFKRRIAEIHACEHCPYIWNNYEKKSCLHPEGEGRFMPDILDIPDWCPLPEAEDENNPPE